MLYKNKYIRDTICYIRYTMYVCMPVLLLKYGKDNYLGILIKHAKAAKAAAAESVAIGSRAGSS